MDFAVTEEHRALRAAVAGIAAEYGGGYYTRKAEARESTSELWTALGTTWHRLDRLPEAAAAFRPACRCVRARTR